MLFCIALQSKSPHLIDFDSDGGLGNDNREDPAWPISEPQTMVDSTDIPAMNQTFLFRSFYSTIVNDYELSS